MSKRINIEKVVVTGFGTFVDKYSFQVDRGGVNIIRGENGAGKTTLFSALVWCLYQINLKGSLNDAVATWKSKRDPKTWNGTRVVTYLSVDGEHYAIARHLKFKGGTFKVPGESDLLIFKANEDGEFTKECLVSGVRGKGDSQEYVDKLLGVDSRTFMNSVMFPQRSRRFVEVDNAEKRKLLEELFDLGFVDQMKERALAKIQKLNGEVTELNTEATRWETRVQGLTDRINDANTALERWRQRKSEELEDLQGQVKKVKKEHDEMETALREAGATIEKLKPKVGDTESVRKRTSAIDAAFQKALEERSAASVYNGQVEREIIRLTKDIVAKEMELSGVKTECPTCGNALKKDQIDTVRKGIKNGLGGLNGAVGYWERLRDAGAIKLKELTTAYDAAAQEKQDKGDVLRKQVQQYTTAVANQKSYTTSLPRLREQMEQIQEKITANKRGDDKPQVANVKELQEENDQLTTQAEEARLSIRKKERIVARYRWWNDIGCSAKGLKAYVFSAMLEQLNIYVKRYAERMGLGVRFSVDLTKSSAPFVTECYKDGEVVDYRDLSGGEKQRIDIAMLFAMHDLVSGVVGFNVLIMDEVFEGLDQEGMEQAFDMIRVKGGKAMTVYVITHSTRVDAMNCHQLRVVKRDGQSYLEAA